MTDAAMIADYVHEIEAKGGDVPLFWESLLPMQIAKLQDIWRRLQ